MIESWKFPQLWTFTVNPRAYPDQRRILEWIKENRCISTMVQAMWRKGWLVSRHFYAVMEFQDGSRNVDGRATEQVHFHVLLDVNQFMPWAEVWEIWESKAAPWRECGNVLDNSCPAMGFVRFDKVYQGEGLAAYLAKGVAGYLSKGPKTLPGWFVGYLDDGHNMQLKYHSRGFFASLPKPKKKYSRPASNPKRKRRSVRERLAACKHDADAYLLIDGKPMWVDRTVWNWETTLQRLADGMSPEQLEQCRRLGRVGVTAAEFVRVAGVDAYQKLVAGNDGQSVGMARWSSAEMAILERMGIPFHTVGSPAECLDEAGDGE